MHDSSDVDDQGVCHPGTRTFVLESVTRWIDDRHPAFFVTWMKGAAGAGKSAIARTVAKRLAQEGLLLASFFCIRSNDRRSNASFVIPTLVDQIITRIPSLRHFIEEVLESDPHIFTKSMELQARRLIVDPLSSIKPELRNSLPRVIIIDGLDEFKDVSGQREILKTIAFLIDNLPSKVHFFIASRPEHQIHDYFAHFIGSKWTLLSLDETYHPNNDIIIYYKDHFARIVATFSSFKLPSDWPGEDTRRVLVMKGSGQFIFAATVVRFVGNTSASMSPQQRLDMVLNNVSKDDLKPLDLLDLVYVTVFSVVPRGELQHILQLVGLVVLRAGFTKSPSVLDAVLGLQPGTTESRLRYLHSVFKVPLASHEPVEPLHATLGDFIFDRRRSHAFGLHLDRDQVHQDIILKILKVSLSHYTTGRLAGEFSFHARIQ